MGMKTVRTVFHKFVMSDVEDPELYAAQPIWEWQQSEAGQWCMEHSISQPAWSMDTSSWMQIYGYRVQITGELTETDYTYWMLRWGHMVDQ
jgi:hypothetical protein